MNLYVRIFFFLSHNELILIANFSNITLRFTWGRRVAPPKLMLSKPDRPEDRYKPHNMDGQRENVWLGTLISWVQGLQTVLKIYSQHKEQTK